MISVLVAPCTETAREATSQSFRPAMIVSAQGKYACILCSAAIRKFRGNYVNGFNGFLAPRHPAAAAARHLLLGTLLLLLLSTLLLLFMGPLLLQLLGTLLLLLLLGTLLLLLLFGTLLLFLRPLLLQLLGTLLLLLLLGTLLLLLLVTLLLLLLGPLLLHKQCIRLCTGNCILHIYKMLFCHLLLLGRKQSH